MILIVTIDIKSDLYVCVGDSQGYIRMLTASLILIAILDVDLTRCMCLLVYTQT